MADSENVEEGASSRTADWEMVSLTASTYAASPGPEDFDSAGKAKEKGKAAEFDSSDALFLSGHFVFPPSEHENLPIEQDFSEIYNEPEGAGIGKNDIIGNNNKKVWSDFNIHQLRSNIVEEPVSTVDSMEFQGVYLVGGEQSLPDLDLSDVENDEVSSYENLESSGKSDKLDGAKEIGGTSLPGEAWWKRHALSLYRHAKEANTFWSVVVAAAVMGLVILGQRWQREKWQLHQLRWQASIADERMSSMLRPLSRFKDIIIGSHHRSPLLHGVGASANV